MLSEGCLVPDELDRPCHPIAPCGLKISPKCGPFQGGPVPLLADPAWALALELFMQGREKGPRPRPCPSAAGAGAEGVGTLEAADQGGGRELRRVSRGQSDPQGHFLGQRKEAQAL